MSHFKKGVGGVYLARAYGLLIIVIIYHGPGLRHIHKFKVVFGIIADLSCRVHLDKWQFEKGQDPRVSGRCLFPPQF